VSVEERKCMCVYMFLQMCRVMQACVCVCLLACVTFGGLRLQKFSQLLGFLHGFSICDKALITSGRQLLDLVRNGIH